MKLKHLLSGLLLLVGTGAAWADKYSDAREIFENAGESAHFFKNCYGYALFPTIGKAGLVIGGAHGEGRVYKGGKHVGDSTVTQLSVGFQLGGQAYSQIVFLQDKRAYDEFTSGEFEFGAQAEAIAITASAGASAGTEGTTASANEKQAEAEYQNGMAVFTMGKGGLMYQATLGGQKYNYEPSK